MSFFCLVVAITLLSFAMNKHYKAIFKLGISNQRSLFFRCLGWGCLLLSFGLIVPIPVNYVIWFVQLSITIIGYSWLLSIREQKNKKLRYTGVMNRF